MSFEAYAISVKLSLRDLVTPALATLGRGIKGLTGDVNAAQRSVGDLEKRLKSLKSTGLLGGALFGVGAVGLSLFKVPIEEAKLFQTEVMRFTSLGFGDKVNSEAVKFATGMKTFGTSARENMTLVSDAMAVFKNLGNAEMVAPLMAKMKFANEAVFGTETGGANTSKFLDLMKVVEFRGGLRTPEEFHTQANYVEKVIAGSRNRVDATSLLTALKTGGVALSQRDNDAFYLGSEPLIQEFGGSRYGTGAMSIYQNLVQGRGTITAQQELYRLGLLDKHKVLFNSQGKLKKALPGAFLGGDVLQKRGELALLEQVLLPVFAKNGITGDAAIINELGMILGNRTGSSLMARIYQQRETLHLQSAANASALGIDDLDAKARLTLAGQELDLHAKWRDVLKELGTNVLPLAIRGVEGLTSILKMAINFGHEFPVLTKGIELASVAIFSLAAAGGALLLLRTAFGGLSLALGVGGAAGGVGLIGALGGLLGPIGLAVAGLGALAVALGVFGNGKKDDGRDHTGLHWELNPSGRGGEWVPDHRMAGMHRGFAGIPEHWVPGTEAGRGSYVADAIGGAKSPPVVVHVHNKIDRRGLTTTVVKEISIESGRPQTGGGTFDPRLSMPPTGGN